MTVPHGGLTVATPMSSLWRARHEADDRRRRRRLRLWVAIAAVLVLPVTTLLILWRLSYQPFGYGNGGYSTLAFPGLPAGHGIHTVNTFGGVHQDEYVPPQPSGYVFYLFADVANGGSRAVTITGVSLPPNGHSLVQAGPVRYAPSIDSYRTRVLHSVTLGHWQVVLLAIPVRTWPCWNKYGGFDTVPDFLVTYHWMFFTHTAAVPWGGNNDELILRMPYDRQGQPDVLCARG